MFKNQFKDFFAEKFLKTEARAYHVCSMVSRYGIIGYVRLGTGPGGRKLET